MARSPYCMESPQCPRSANISHPFRGRISSFMLPGPCWRPVSPYMPCGTSTRSGWWSSGHALGGTGCLEQRKEQDYGPNGTALREKPCEIEGFGYEPLRHSLPEVLGILLTSDESVDG